MALKSLMRILAVAGVLIAVAVGLGFYWPFEFGRHTLRLPGVVVIQEVRLGSKVGGGVAKILVQEGDLVMPGQVLVRFDVPEIEAQREQCRARLRASEAKLAKAQNGPRREEKDEAHAAAEAARVRWEMLKNGAR